MPGARAEPLTMWSDGGAIMSDVPCLSGVRGGLVGRRRVSRCERECVYECMSLELVWVCRLFDFWGGCSKFRFPLLTFVIAPF